MTKCYVHEHDTRELQDLRISCYICRLIRTNKMYYQTLSGYVHLKRGQNNNSNLLQLIKGCKRSLVRYKRCN